ncbi:MAG TPA: cytochrome c oxidase accessory protein CcoG [Limnobacter sp.]|uniref:cytochrome c oxidase accessory protein CcoG n=1 Tax=Limnobacter sp. TaxID=2003368 RepID=UPI002EDB8B87
MHITPEPQAQVVSLFKADDKVVPRTVHGPFARARWVMVWLTQLAYYGTAWLQWNGRQAVLFDVESRRFLLGPLVFYPQDFIFLTGLLIVSALSLFLFTAVAGRVWCGYACPQTVYTEIFLWFERTFEGDRSARLRLSAGPWTAERILKTSAKQFSWIVFAVWTGFTFVGYFTPIRVLWHDTLALQLGGWSLFWIAFYSVATYGNAGFMREQVCKYMCPYARFQSAMFDKDTLLITYDAQRGEPRGSRSKKADPATLGLGSCVDCTLCVQVCPTGIDIRKGLQYECIGCAACVDVCDQVMDKMGYARGLVKYSTQNAVQQGWSARQMLQRALRPRVLVYTAVLWSLIAALAAGIAMRPELRVDVVRDRSVNYRLVDDGRIENVYRLMMMNTTEHTLQVTVKAQGDGDYRVVEADRFEVLPSESRWVVVRVQGNPDVLQAGANHFQFQLQGDGIKPVNEQATFLAPN